MPWCPKCKVEYREDFKKCSDCDSDLVEILVNESENVSYVTDDKEEYLMSFTDSFEADMVEVLLLDSGIPVLKKNRGAGAYFSAYMGASNSGVDLYVPSKLLERAKELVQVFDNNNNENTIETTLFDNNNDESITEAFIQEDDIQSEKKQYNNQGIFSWIIILFIIFIFYYLYTR